MHPALVTAIPAGMSAVASYFGGRSADKTNVKLAREQMAFQEHMSSSAFSRAKADMEGAGLNPGLMFGSGGPASTPAGSLAQVKNRLGESAQRSVNSALSATRLRKEIQIMDHQAKLLEQQTREASGRADSAGAKGYLDKFELQSMLNPGGWLPGSDRSGPPDAENSRNLVRWFENRFDRQISEREALDLQNVLRRLAQPGAQADARLMAEIDKFDPFIRMLLLTLNKARGR